MLYFTNCAKSRLFVASIDRPGGIEVRWGFEQSGTPGVLFAKGYSLEVSRDDQGQIAGIRTNVQPGGIIQPMNNPQVRRIIFTTFNQVNRLHART